MRVQYWFCFLFVGFILNLSCKDKANGGRSTEFYVDPDWIEVHFTKDMQTEKLVEIRDRLVGLGVLVKFLVIQRDSNKMISNFQIEVQDGKGSIAHSRTEFLDNIPYGIRINRKDPSGEGFKVGPLYLKRPE